MHTYDADSDPAPAFDSRAGAFSLVSRSMLSAMPAWSTPRNRQLDAQGSFFFNISSFGRRFIVDEENDARALSTSHSLTADIFGSSPNRDNVYATWTVFNFSCGPKADAYCSAPIFGSMSTTMDSRGPRRKRLAAAPLRFAFSATPSIRREVERM